MGTLSLTKPTIGQPNSTEDVKIPNAFTAIETFVNGANVATGQIEAASLADLQGPGTAWKQAHRANILVANNKAATNVVLGVTRIGSTTLLGLNGGLGTGDYLVYLDPADWTYTARTVKVRIRVVLHIGNNGAAPGVNFTFNLSPVATWVATDSPDVATVGAALCTTTFTTPAKDSHTVQSSVEATLSSAASYLPLMTLSGTTGATCSWASVEYWVQYRIV